MTAGPLPHNLVSDLAVLDSQAPLFERMTRLHGGVVPMAAVLTLRALIAPKTDDRWAPVAGMLNDLPLQDPESIYLRWVYRASRPGRSRDLYEALTGYSTWLEQDGEIAAARYVAAVAQHMLAGEQEEEDVRVGLLRGRLARRLSLWDEATACYRGARDASHARGFVELRHCGELGLGIVQRLLGNLPAARKVFEQVIEACTTPDLVQVRGMGYGELSAVLYAQNDPVESAWAEMRHLEYSDDPIEQARACGNLGTIARELGAVGIARIAFQLVPFLTEDWVLRTNARIELMGLASDCGEDLSFRMFWNVLLREVEQMPPSTRVDFHYQLGRGLWRFAHVVEGERELRTALAIAEKHRLNEWTFRVERALTTAPTLAESAPILNDGEHLRLAEVELDLGRFAAAAGAAAS